MGRIDKDTRLRLDGMVRALEVAERGGIEALRAEVRMRGATGIPCTFTLEKSREIWRTMAGRIYSTYASSAAMSIHDVFGAGQDRLKRWKKRFDWYVQQVSTVDGYGQKWMDFEDMARELNDRYHLGLDEDVAKAVDNINNSQLEMRASVPAICELLRREGYEAAAEFLHGFLPEAFEEEAV